MLIDEPLALLGGLSPAVFMRRHWQKKPLLVRQAVAGAVPPVSVARLFELAARDDVESRLVVQSGGQWRLRPGPLPRRVLPALKTPGWSLLVQGLDLHEPAAHALLSQFRFVPEARLDDLMVSYASDGGGVGPHLDSYDVFLLQVQGRRRWRIGRVPEPVLREGVPLKMLANFEPEDEWLLEPGDMLYLPPRWGHEGVAEGGGCITCSIGFHAPRPAELARDLLQRVADFHDDDEPGVRPYRDPQQPATAEPGRIPAALSAFALEAVQRALREPDALACALGESLTEPKHAVWFEAGRPLRPGAAVALDRRTRMLYDERHVFINGESMRAGGRDATLMRELADQRRLPARTLLRASDAARELLSDWAVAGWLHAEEEIA
jgi:50S ribosomal protein L16 3-hydroxylase